MKIHDNKTFDKTRFNQWKSATQTSQASMEQTVVNTTHSNINAYHTNNHSNTAEYTTYNYTPHTNTTSLARETQDTHVDSIDNNDFIVGAYDKDTITYTQTEYNRTYRQSGDNIHYDVGTYYKAYEKDHSDYSRYSEYSEYSKYSQHTDQAEYTQAIVHPHVNTGHSNNIPHSNYGFTHNNTIPYTPDVYDISNGDRFKDTVTIGYFSYDKENDPVYYDISYRQTQNLDGSTNVSGWVTLSSNTTNNTININTISMVEGIYEFQIKAYNAPRNENGLSQTYQSGVKTFTVKIQQNKAPVIQNIQNTILTVQDIDTKWANNKPINFEYKVYDYDGNDVITKHYIDNNLFATVTNSTGSKINFTISKDVWERLAIGSHEIKIEVTDNIDDGIPFTKTIIKLDDRLLFVTNPYQTPQLATKSNITLLHKKEVGDLLQIWICNNAFDENPAWEDCTDAYLKRTAYIFKNKTKVNDKAGISMKILLKKSFAKN